MQLCLCFCDVQQYVVVVILFVITLCDTGCGITTTEKVNNSVTLNICIIMERGSSRNILTNYDKVGAAIDMGLEYVHEDILPEEIRLRKIYRDAGDTCEVDQIQKAALEALLLIKDNIQCDLYLGPGCVDAVIDICNIAAYTGTPVISFPAGGITNAATPRRVFPMLIRLSYRLQSIAATILVILRTLSFVHTYVFVDVSVGFHVSMSVILFERLRAATDASYLRYNKFEYLEANITDSELQRHLRLVRLSSRAVILLCGGVLTRRLMFLAAQLEMTSGDYLYIAIELFESYYWGIFTWRGDEEKEDQILRAYDSLLLIALDTMSNDYYKSFASLYQERAEREYGYNFDSEGPFIDEADATVMAMFDAMVLYASALRSVNEAGDSVRNYSAVLEAMKGKTYESPITDEIFMDSNGDRERRFYVQDILPQGQYDNVLEVNGTSFEVTISGNFHWPGNGPAPVDVPFCGFDGNDAKCSKAFRNSVIAGSVVAVLAVVCSIATGNWYLKRYGRKNPFWWRISSDELDIVPVQRSTTVSTAEVPMDNSNQSLDSIAEQRQFQPYTFLADYRGARVRLIQYPEKTFRPTHAVVKEMNIIKNLHHSSLLRFIGICLDEQGYCQYCLEEQSEKGSLFDLIADEAHIIDDVFKLSFVRDITQGMQFLHSTVIISHGFLRSRVCHVNSKFMVRISDFGLPHLRSQADFLPPKMSDESNKDCYVLLYRAPELLRIIMPRNGTQKGDVYSFAIILQEILTKSKPYLLSHYNEFFTTARTISIDVKRSLVPPTRPKVAKSSQLPALYEQMDKCWEEDPLSRPTFQKINEALSKLGKRSGRNIVDHLIRKMEQYTQQLEEEVHMKMQQLVAEKERSDNLLKHMLPKSVAAILTRGESVLPETFQSVTIMFSDIPGFTDLVAKISAFEVLEALNSLNQWGDLIMEHFEVYKVESIMDIYMIASGLPVRNASRHAAEITKLAIKMRKDVHKLRTPGDPSKHLQIRFGIHSGSCVAGIVGLKMPRYCLFGDAVNTASRMQSSSEAMKIQITSSTKSILDDTGGFLIEERGVINVKGKGEMTTFWVKAASLADT